MKAGPSQDDHPPVFFFSSNQSLMKKRPGSISVWGFSKHKLHSLNFILCPDSPLPIHLNPPMAGPTAVVLCLKYHDMISISFCFSFGSRAIVNLFQVL